MKKISKRTCFCIVVFGILFLFWAIRNIQYSEKGTIDSAAVCAENGDVAISYDSNPLNVVALYDKESGLLHPWADRTNGCSHPRRLRKSPRAGASQRCRRKWAYSKQCFRA